MLASFSAGVASISTVPAKGAGRSPDSQCIFFSSADDPMTTLFTVEAKLSARLSPCGRFRNQHIGRDAQALVQSSDHGQRQRTLAAQDFVDAVAFADDRLKIFDG